MQEDVISDGVVYFQKHDVIKTSLQIQTNERLYKTKNSQ